MLKPGTLAERFVTYWEEMDRCRGQKTYWALLHMTVCLPDICAALESHNGESRGDLYVAWCDRHLPDPYLTGAERWRMRCKVLHQGRATTDQAGRYTGFSFGQPAANGYEDHGRVDGAVLSVDVGRLAAEVRAGVERWIQEVEGNPGAAAASYTERNLASLVRVAQVLVPVAAPTGGPAAYAVVSKTN